MVSHRKKLEESLEQSGWKLIEVREIEHRWFVEMWLVKSLWSPTDCCVFLSFETDPQSSSLSEKPVAEMIVASLQKPVDWFAEHLKQFEKNEPFDDRTYLYLGKNIEKKIPVFLNDLSKMRQRFSNFYYKN